MIQASLIHDQALSRLAFQTRRSVLRAGSFGLASLGGATFGGESERSSAAKPATQHDTACVVFFLDGGPSHLDTFDPKPDAPAEVRGEFEPIDTAVPGMRIAEHLPRLARQARHFSLVRSLYHGNPSHAPAEHQMLTGWMGSREGTARAVIENPSLGSIVARLAGSRRDGAPAYVAVPWSFHHAYGGSPFGSAAYLGPRYEPLESGQLPGSTTAPFELLTLKLGDGMSLARLGDRSALLGSLEQPAETTPSEDVHRAGVLRAQAIDLLLSSPVREAFELAREPARVREGYGAHEWGQAALLARRLVEVGVSFVMLQCGLRQDWDTHKTNFTKLRTELLPALDQAVAALIEDLAQRGRLASTLVLVTGEFGRTP
ncbi:MAG TPA: DUF1501 domain-containing protein, partial [Pirellulales bacterium]|nr:DUF1501 domain-containing protein [Pirellulales bacterium]